MLKQFKKKKIIGLKNSFLLIIFSLLIIFFLFKKKILIGSRYKILIEQFRFLVSSLLFTKKKGVIFMKKIGYLFELFFFLILALKLLGIIPHFYATTRNIIITIFFMLML